MQQFFEVHNILNYFTPMTPYMYRKITELRVGGDQDKIEGEKNKYRAEESENQRKEKRRKKNKDRGRARGRERKK